MRQRATLRIIQWLLARAHALVSSLLKPPAPRGFACLRVSLGQFSLTAKKGFEMRLNTEQKVLVQVMATTLKGNPAPIDGDVVFGVSDTTVATVEPVDATSCYIVGLAPGVVQVTADFDADLGEGVRPVGLSGALEVVSAEATSGELVFNDPIDA